MYPVFMSDVTSAGRPPLWQHYPHRRDPGSFCLVKKLLQFFRTTDMVAVDKHLRHCGSSRDGAQGGLGKITIQRQFLEANPGIVQQALGTYTVRATHTGEYRNIQRFAGSGRNVIQYDVRIGDFKGITRHIRLDEHLLDAPSFTSIE